jgi:uncharacterized membrane protein
VYNTIAAVPKASKFDLPPFNILTLVVSLEAIFLSTFILNSQNRQRRIADHRNHLDLQINLLAEQENSQMLVMMKQVMDHLGIATSGAAALLQEQTDPEHVAKQIGESLEQIRDSSLPGSDSPPL